MEANEADPAAIEVLCTLMGVVNTSLAAICAVAVGVGGCGGSGAPPGMTTSATAIRTAMTAEPPAGNAGANPLSAMSPSFVVQSVLALRPVRLCLRRPRHCCLPANSVRKRSGMSGCVSGGWSGQIGHDPKRRPPGPPGGCHSRAERRPQRREHLTVALVRAAGVWRSLPSVPTFRSARDLLDRRPGSGDRRARRGGAVALVFRRFGRHLGPSGRRRGGYAVDRGACVRAAPPRSARGGRGADRCTRC